MKTKKVEVITSANIQFSTQNQAKSKKSPSRPGADPENFGGGMQFWIRLNVNWTQRH